MPMFVSPLFWEWFNIWLIQFLKDLYHEIKMVALRGMNTQLNSSHGCIGHGNQSQQNASDMTQSLQTPLSAASQHINANQINLQQLNNISLQFLPQRTNSFRIKQEQISAQYSNCMLPSHHYRRLTQRRPECYHPANTTGPNYMASTAGTQPAPQQALRVQPTPQQQTAPPTQPQDMTKTTMAGHNFVSPQNQTAQPRSQYSNYSYRGAAHGTRPNTHPRQQQQQFIPGAPGAAPGPVVIPFMYSPTIYNQQSFQQTRSQGYSLFMPYMNYSPPTGHTSSYFYQPNNQQLSTPNLPANTPGGRNNPTTLVGPQGASSTSTPHTPTLQHPQVPSHMHQPIPVMRSQTRRSYRVPIIDPATNQEICSEINTNDSQYLSSESNSERQTPQPDATHASVEEFKRAVIEVANQPSATESVVKSNFVNKIPDLPSTINTIPPQNAIIPTNNVVIKSDNLFTVNENKSQGPEIAEESNETPIVSAMADSPVIVPKLPNKPKSSEQSVQSIIIDTNKHSIAIQQTNKQKSKPVVPQEELEEVPSDNNSLIVTNTEFEAISQIQAASDIAIPTQITQVPTPVPVSIPAPQPQRIREPRERVKSEEKFISDQNSKEKENSEEKEIPSESTNLNGPSGAIFCSVEDIKTTASQNISNTEPIKDSTIETSNEEETIFEPEIDLSNEIEESISVPSAPSATERLSASIEKVGKDLSILPESLESKEASSAIEAQAKLTQSIASCRTNQPQAKMKDNNKPLDPDTANGNSNNVNKTETSKKDINKNEKSAKNSKNSNKVASNKKASSESNVKDQSCKNGKDETDDVSNVEQETGLEPQEESSNVLFPKVVLKYKYSEDQWSPSNTTGKKCYDIGLLKQIKEDPMSKNKPNAPLLEACNVIRNSPLQEPPKFAPISMTMFETITPAWKNAGMSSKINFARDLKKMPNQQLSGKDTMKSVMGTSSGNSSHKPIIRFTLSLRDDIKLNETENAWKPSRFKRSDMTEDEFKTQELYKKFRGILNKLTPEKFDTLLERIKTLEINTQKRLEGVIDLVFEKAIDEPNFSEAYAAMCDKLSMLKVPIDNATSQDQCVNFRGLIISKCQNQFELQKADEQVVKLENEVAACTDPAKKKELLLLLEEENRRVRMRSVGNVRFIGELYKLKMLTSKIMVYCMNHLIDKLEEEKLECLCKLLTTIGEQVEKEMKEQLDNVFKKMHDIVERKSNRISSRVRFMIQDVIALRKRKWVVKSVVDLQPKMMDQIQKEAEYHQRQIELTNANTGRRDEGPRNKRGGDGRRQNSYNDNQYKPTKANFVFDPSKLKAVHNAKNISNVKLAPTNTAWMQGSSTKNTAKAASNSIGTFTKNKFSELANLSMDNTSLLTGMKDVISYPKGASIERSTFNSRGDFSSGSNSRSGSTGVPRSNSSSRNPSTPVSPAIVPQTEPPSTQPSITQEPLPEDTKKKVKSMIDLFLINPDDEEMVAEVKHLFSPQYHSALVTEIIYIALEKSPKKVSMIAKSVLHLVSTNTISPENFKTGLADVFECPSDLYIDIPMCYDHIGEIIAPHIEKKHVTLRQIWEVSNNVIAVNHGQILLKAIIKELKERMGPSFVKTKWQESALQFNNWMQDDQVAKWIDDNRFEFLEGVNNANMEAKKIMTPSDTQRKLLQLMNTDESCDCIKGWVRDNLGKCSNEDWFMRALIQAICEHALSRSEHLRFSQDKMNKYSSLIDEFGENKEAREANCLFGIQQLIHRLEHPQGLTLEIFQYLHEQYIISVNGFIAWNVSEKEPEGKAVMKIALASFFTNIEADNEDSCSED